MLIGFNGEMPVDRIYRFEEMDEAIVDLARRLHLPTARIARKNASRRPHREYYGGGEWALVQRISRRDLERFEYRFSLG
jgi:hypothetical protein